MAENYEELYLDATWIRLLHYHNYGRGWESKVDSEDFFLSKEGRTNPIAELKAFIEALHEDEFVLTDGQSVQCRFPARTAWALKHFQSVKLQKRTCVQLTRWKEFMSLDRVSIVFASSSMDNPSSMFGHTFLKLSRGDETGGYWGINSSTVNFFADASDELNSLRYVYKGFSGGFQSVLDNKKMYRRIREYSENQLRDMWEYELDFSKEDIAMIVDHAWEVKDGVQQYYFISENCGYRTLELLAVAKPDLLEKNRHRFRSLPIDTIRILRNKNYVKGIKYLPSSKVRFNQGLSLLSSSERRLVKDIVRNGLASSENQEKLAKLEYAMQSQVLDLALKYAGYEIQRGNALDHKLNETVYQLIKKRLELGVLDASPFKAKSSVVTPDVGHKSTKVSIAASSNKFGEYYTVGVRFSGHDILDPVIGFPKSSAIEFSKFGLKLMHGELLFEEFSLLRAKSLIPYDPFFPVASWSVDLSIKDRWYGGDSSTTAIIGGGYGYSIGFSGLALSLLGTVAVNKSRLSPKNVDFEYGGSISVIQQGEYLSYDLSFKKSNYIDNSMGDRESVEFELSMPYSKNVLWGYSARLIRVQGLRRLTHSLGVNYFF